MTDQSSDPVVQQFREQISDLDLAILDSLNKRLALVQKLHAYKKQQGYDVVDANRESWVLTYVARANRGPLGDEAIRAFWPNVIELMVAEAARLNAAAAAASS